MSAIDDFRKQTGNAYADLSDFQLAKGIYEKFYSKDYKTFIDFAKATGHPLEKLTDIRTGAPVNVRAAVGAVEKPADRLATVKKFYPDAQPYEDNNFIYTNPKTGQPTLMNEVNQKVLGIPLPTKGDIAGAAPEIAEMVGGGMGATLGLLSSAPTGGTASVYTVPTMSAAGALTGKTLAQEYIRRMFGSAPDTRNIIEAGTEAGSTFLSNMLGQRLGEVAPEVVKQTIGPALRYVGGKIAPQSVGPSARRLGVELPAGAATGNKSIQTIESGVASMPAGAQVIGPAYEKAISQTGGAAKTLAERFGTPMSKEGAGAEIKAAAKNAVERFKQTRTSLDDNVEGFIGPDTMVSVDNATNLLNDLKAQLVKAPESLGPSLNPSIQRLEGIIADASANNGMIPFGILRKVRTSIGQELDNTMAAGVAPQSKQSLNSVYGSLSEDIKNAALQAGPDAEKALKTHDRYVRLFRNSEGGRVPPSETLEKIIQTDTDAKAFNLAMSGSKDSGQQLARLRGMFKPEEWDIVSASVLDNLGRAKAGQRAGEMLGEEISDFSANSFLTNWNNLSSSAKTALFGGKRYAELKQPLDDLVNISNALRDAEKMKNYSNTARSLMTGLGFAAIGGGIGFAGNGDVGSNAVESVMAAAGSSYMAGKLLTNPKFVNWLTQSVNVTNKNPNALIPQLSRLAAIADADAGIRDEIYQYIGEVAPNSQAE